MWGNRIPYYTFQSCYNLFQLNILLLRKHDLHSFLLRSTYTNISFLVYFPDIYVLNITTLQGRSVACTVYPFPASKESVRATLQSLYADVFIADGLCLLIALAKATRQHPRYVYRRRVRRYTWQECGLVASRQWWGNRGRWSWKYPHEGTAMT